MLDVCTGLAYTAIMASELENVSSVTTIELDPTMTQICAMNPHSKGLFGRAQNTTKNNCSKIAAATLEQQCSTVAMLLHQKKKS